MDKNAVINALNSDFKDFEDALQNFSAMENGQIKIILTRNLKDFKKSELAVLTPETYLKGKASGSHRIKSMWVFIVCPKFCVFLLCHFYLFIYF